MLGYLSLDIICSSKLTVFLELCSRKTVRFSEQRMSADKYPSIFSRQMETTVYLCTSTLVNNNIVTSNYCYVASCLSQKLVYHQVGINSALYVRFKVKS